MTKRTRLEAMAEEYGDKTGSSILYGDWRKVYTDGIRRGIEMCIAAVKEYGLSVAEICLDNMKEKLEAEE